MNTLLRSQMALFLLGTSLAGAPQSFDFKDPKGVNNVVFKLDAPLEAINGTASGISGNVQFDPENPSVTRGTIVVESASLHVPNPIMKEHLQSEPWMDVAAHPTIEFRAQSLENIQTSGGTTTAVVKGELTLRGKTRPLTAPVKLTYLPDKLGERTNGRLQGDLLVIRSTFTIKRTEYDINPGAPQDKVSDEIELTLSIAGAAPRP